jgi:hypothetical protein
MAMTIVETRAITGGVDTHLDVHVAAALDAIGGVLGVESFLAELEDPSGLGVEAVRPIRDEIGCRVRQLLAELGMRVPT